MSERRVCVHGAAAQACDGHTPGSAELLHVGTTLLVIWLRFRFRVWYRVVGYG